MDKGVIKAVCAACLWAAPCAAPAADDVQTLAKTVATVAAARRVKRVAVVPFTAPRGSGSYDGAIVSERLVIQILARGELDVVERRFLEQVLEEQRLGAFGIMDPGTVRALGKVLGVDAILTGTVIALKGGRVEINARLVHAETAQVLAASTAVMAKDWEERPIVEDAATWIVPVPELPENPLDIVRGGGTTASCQAKVDAVERRLLDFKARYWADRLKDPKFSLKSLSKNPGSEIRDDEIRADFYKKMREHYDDKASSALTTLEREQLAKGLQEIKVLSGICEG